MRRKPWILLLAVAMLAGFVGTGQADVLFASGASNVVGVGNITNLFGAPDFSNYARFNNGDSANLTFGANFGDGFLPDVDVFIELSFADGFYLPNLDLYAHRLGGGFDELNGYLVYEISGSGVKYDFLRLVYSGSGNLDVDAVAVNYGAVPEPSTLLLLGSGLLGLVGYGRRRFKK